MKVTEGLTNQLYSNSVLYQSSLIGGKKSIYKELSAYDVWCRLCRPQTTLRPHLKAWGKGQSLNLVPNSYHLSGEGVRGTALIFGTDCEAPIPPREAVEGSA